MTEAVVKVTFNSIDEFLAELEPNLEQIAGGIVRMTVRQRFNTAATHIRNMSVSATCVIRRVDLAQLIDLEAPMGARFVGMPEGEGSPNAETEKAIDDGMAQIRSFLKANGLTDAAGTFTMLGVGAPVGAP